MIARPEFNVLPCAFKIYVWRHVNFCFTLVHSCNWPPIKISYLLLSTNGNVRPPPWLCTQTVTDAKTCQILGGLLHCLSVLTRRKQGRHKLVKNLRFLLRFIFNFVSIICSKSILHSVTAKNWEVFKSFE